MIDGVQKMLPKFSTASIFVLKVVRNIIWFVKIYEVKDALVEKAIYLCRTGHEEKALEAYEVNKNKRQVGGLGYE